MRIRGDDAAGLMPDGRESGVRVAFERIEEPGVAVAHDAEDMIDVGGEGAGDVRGDGGHDEAFRDDDGRGGFRMCLAGPAGSA
ncbi:hypothetical protein GCM10025870_09140 [Agromyces marinus]|uniref:Uncharacterized protein n=1 Tax=Agromyces marinus TaxID=1389020 RepID=A0ABN6Y9Y3_9MICO|nr:hypothetical protein GCM10025870_09140 [Agromyces marinus]